jgi:hypothetical protein
VTTGALPEKYYARYPGLAVPRPTCTTEIVIGFEDTGIMLDRPVPGEIPRWLTCQPRRGPRPVRHVSSDGRLLHPHSMQGIYRLAESFAADLEAVPAGPPVWPILLSGHASTTTSPQASTRFSDRLPATR